MTSKLVLLLCVVLALGCEGPPSAPGALPGNAEHPVSAAERLRLAERIYREGVLPSGEPLRGVRAGARVSGAQAACVQCHRRSGMGTVEGTTIVPPIAGRFLREPRARTPAELSAGATRGPDLAHAFGRDRSRDPYTDRTLARAIREGIDPAGGALDEPMPRYALSEEDTRLLIEYLDQLSTGWSPGVTRDTLHLGTVVAPGVDPARQAAMLDVLDAFFQVKNAKTDLERRREQAFPESAHSTYRTWKLHVFQLRGPPETWGEELTAYVRSQPVFALLSGLSEGAWAPVQSFCEEQRLPCWFPIVDLPPAPETMHYTAYFTRGVLLEAELLAHRLRDAREAKVLRVIQIHAGDTAAAGAARALEQALAGSGIQVEERLLPRADGAALRDAAAGARSSDAVVLWLRRPEVARLAEAPPPPATVYFSVTLAGGDHVPLPPAWKAQARLLDPFELPDARRANVTRFHAWLRTRGLALVDERVQADAYLACLFLSEKIDEMLEDLHRDYLLERAEAILSTRLTTATYHRLSLGPGQRFASKGGYIARFADPGGDALVADGGWIVP